MVDLVSVQILADWEVLKMTLIYPVFQLVSVALNSTGDFSWPY